MLQTTKSTKTTRSPRVPDALIQQYVRELFRLQQVSGVVSPDHPWFQFQVYKTQAAADALKAKMQNSSIRIKIAAKASHIADDMTKGSKVDLTFLQEGQLPYL